MPACTKADLGTKGLCGPTMKCTVTNPATGDVGCRLAGSKELWQTCTDDLDCQDGDWCDLNLSVCKPFCQNVNDCAAFGGECRPTLQEAVSMQPPPEIDGVKSCVSMCAPKTGAPCATMQGVTCVFVGSNRFDCGESQGLVTPSACSSHQDCAAGYACVGDECRLWCSPPELFSPDCVLDCVGLNPAIFFTGDEYGVCG